MVKGCLSGIKPGRGTNRNEALHRKLNHIMGASRYRVELAYALLTTSTMRRCWQWQKKRAEMPHFAYQQISCPMTEKFGLIFPQSVMNTAASWSQSSPSNEVPLKSSNYDAIKKRILNIRPVEPALVHVRRKVMKRLILILSSGSCKYFTRNRSRVGRARGRLATGGEMLAQIYNPNPTIYNTLYTSYMFMYSVNKRNY